MAYLKPQSPLEKEGNYFYPLTTADQVILDDGSRLDRKLGNNNEQFKVLISTEWDGVSAPYTQEITVPEIKEGDTPIADIVLADDYGTAAIQEKEWSKIFKIATADEKIVVYANALTEIELEVQMIVSRDKILTVEELPEGFVGERELAPASVSTEKLADGSVTLGKLAQEVLELFYQPGSLYINANNINPKELLGFGEWVQIKDRFILAAGDTYVAGSTGGEAEHTLTVDEMPKHRHVLPINYGSNDGNVRGISSWSDSSLQKDTSYSSDYAGGSQPHNNMPPYQTFYVWMRVS